MKKLLRNSILKCAYKKKVPAFFDRPSYRKKSTNQFKIEHNLAWNSLYFFLQPTSTFQTIDVHCALPRAYMGVGLGRRGGGPYVVI